MPPWTIFLQTLSHDFDALLWLNPGDDPVEVYATADALVAPYFKGFGMLDTAIVVITFDNGARAIPEASFSAAYGYDVRAEVFNLFNRVWWGAPEANFSSTNFGMITSQGNSPRQMQFGFKYIF